MYFSYIGQRVGCVMLCFASLCGPGESIASGRRDKVVCVLFSSWCLVCLLFFASCTLISFFSWCVPVLYWSFLCIYIFFLYSHHFHFLLCNLGYFLFIFRCFYLDLFIFLFFFFISFYLSPSLHLVRGFYVTHAVCIREQPAGRHSSCIFSPCIAFATGDDDVGHSFFTCSLLDMIF